jgi:hypothetical protein
MPAHTAYTACMKKKAPLQYTIRGVSSSLDRKLRERAIKENKSLNEVTVSTLERALGVTGDSIRYDDLDDLAGTWVSDPAFDKAVKSLHKIDTELWK